MFFTALPATLEDGTYNGYSTATIGGLPGQLVLCDDYAHETVMPSSSNLIYYYSTLTGPDPLEYVRFTKGNEIRNYEEAAVLLARLSAEVVAGSATADEITNYQYAVWNLFDPSEAKVNSAQKDLQRAAFDTVRAGGRTALDAYSRLAIYTPTAAFAGNQEFLGFNAPVGAPEPSAAPVLSLILGVACLCFRRRR